MVTEMFLYFHVSPIGSANDIGSFRDVPTGGSSVPSALRPSSIASRKIGELASPPGLTSTKLDLPNNPHLLGLLTVPNIPRACSSQYAKFLLQIYAVVVIEIGKTSHISYPAAFFRITWRNPRRAVGREYSHVRRILRCALL